MKKPLIAFVVTFALSLGFTYLSVATRAAVLTSVSSNNAASDLILDSTLISTSLSLAGLTVSFVVFYFLANRNKIAAVKSTTLAVLLGAILGPVTLYLGLTANYDTILELYLSQVTSSAISSVFYFFLPALTALLFAELREKKANHNLTEEKEGLSSI